MRLLLVVLALFIPVGCTKSNPAPAPVAAVICPFEAGVASGLSSFIVSTCTCANSAQVSLDVGTSIGGIAGLCPASTNATASVKPQGVVGAVVCPLIVNGLAALAPAALPATWQCTSCTAGLAPVTTALTTLCEGAIPLVKVQTK